MEETLIKNTDINIYINEYWKKTLVYKLSLGKSEPSKGWIKQLKRMLENKIPTSSPNNNRYII